MPKRSRREARRGEAREGEGVRTLSEAMTMSHIIASSQPPPSARPFTAATIGSLHLAAADHALPTHNPLSSASEPAGPRAGPRKGSQGRARGGGRLGAWGRTARGIRPR